MRRLLLGVLLFSLTVPTLAEPHGAAPLPSSVASAIDDCYYYEVDLPPYGQEARVCPPPTGWIRGVLPDV